MKHETINIFEILTSKPTNYHYISRYYNFLNACRDLNQSHLTTEYTEIHHICPKCLWPEFNRNPLNLLRLTARQHFIAHWILSKSYTGYNNRRVSVAFFRMTIKSDVTQLRYTSSNYEYAKRALSTSMKLFNPMFDPIIKEKAIQNMKASVTPERRAAMSKARTGVNNITESGINSLSNFWKGKSRPKTLEHVNNHRKSQSTGMFVTPYGEFYSPNDASKSDLNVEKLSPYQIRRRCNASTDNFKFVLHEN